MALMLNAPLGEIRAIRVHPKPAALTQRFCDKKQVIGKIFIFAFIG
jgi:hypothetical protein